MENLPAAGESPLSSAVVAKAKDRDDGRGRADLLVERIMVWWSSGDDGDIGEAGELKTFKRGGRGSSPSVGGLKPGNPRPRM